jgi:hypothetical protein
MMLEQRKYLQTEFIIGMKHTWYFNTFAALVVLS